MIKIGEFQTNMNIFDIVRVGIIAAAVMQISGIDDENFQNELSENLMVHKNNPDLPIIIVDWVAERNGLTEDAKQHLLKTTKAIYANSAEMADNKLKELRTIAKLL